MLQVIRSLTFFDLLFLVVGYGAQILVLQKAVELLEKEGISVELIDLSMDPSSLLHFPNESKELLLLGISMPSSTQSRRLVVW